MKIRYNKEKLGQITNDLFVLTGMSIAVLDDKLSYICRHTKSRDFCNEMQKDTEHFNNRCDKADKCLVQRCSVSGVHEHHICHAGLYDAILPIKKNGKAVCYVLMGRVRTADSPKEFHGSSELCALYNEVPYFTDERIQSMSSLLQSILFDEAVSLESDPLAEEIAEYISENYNGDISVSSICEKFFISKNSLYNTFRSHYGKTINDYITDVRIKAAMEMLRETDDPIYRVCEKSGFGTCTYFCRIFKKVSGVSPVEYRKKHRLSFEE